jgi:hypothetical protein
MGLIAVSPPSVVPPRSLRLVRQTRRDVETAPPTPEPIELIKSCAETYLRSAEAIAASRIAQRFAARTSHAAPPSTHRSAAEAPPSTSALDAGIRKLAALIIIATLLPNLAVAAFWLGLAAPPWSKTQTSAATESVPSGVQPAIPLPVLSSPEALRSVAGSEISLPIALDGTDGIPSGSNIMIRGLPQGASLSNGLPQAGAGWMLKPGDIGDLTLAVPATAVGDALLTIRLVAPSGRIVADTATLLEVTPAPPFEPPLESEGAGEQAMDQQEEVLQAAAEETAALPQEVSGEDTPPLPDRRPNPDASENSSGDWVKPSAYVNLRGSPSSSAAVIGVVAKGAKLRVMDRKRGWVQVSNPATKVSGWIYSGNIENVP